MIKMSESLKAPVHQVFERVEKLIEENKSSGNELREMRKNQLQQLVQTLISQTETIGNIPSIIEEISCSMEDLKVCMELLNEKFVSGIVVLACAVPGKCQIMTRVSQDLVSQGFSANDLLKVAMPVVEGSGGGRPNGAQGAGKSPEKIGQALQKVREHLLLQVGQQTL